VVEVYVPIMKGGLFLGAFEIYYDITTRLQAIERLISHSTLAVVALSGGLLVLLLMVSFKMAQSQAALRESEARFRALTEGALAGVYIIQDGVFRYVNPALAQFFGYTPEEIIDKLGPTDLTCPEDRPLVAEQVRRRLAGEVEAVHYSFRGLRKDGSILHCEVLGRRIDYRGKPAIMGTFLDVTERKEAEQALRESEERFRGISASAQDAIIMMDPEGRISYWNQAAENIFGYKAEEAIGQFLDKLIIPEALRADFQRGLREFRKTGQGPAVGQRVEFNALRKGGQEFPVELSLSSLQIGGQWNAIGMVRDVTERKRAEEELRSAHRELQEAYEALEKAHASAIAAEKMAALGRLTAGVSHEILNPLFVVSMNLRLLLTDSELPSHVAEKLREVDEQVHRIDKITQNLLYFARKRKPERRPLNLNDTIRRTIELMDHDLRLKGITVELDLDEGLPTLAADQDQLQQVILNLMTNARDAVAEGGRITLTTRLIEDGKPSVELRVEDTGPGIDPKHMDKIFDPFFTTKPEGEGTGLGLSICQGIVEAHGGAIWAENVPGKGAAFVVRLEVE
jgi:PAS domain S-box-containing protein